MITDRQGVALAKVTPQGRYLDARKLADLTSAGDATAWLAAGGDLDLGLAIAKLGTPLVPAIADMLSVAVLEAEAAAADRGLRLRQMRPLRARMARWWWRLQGLPVVVTDPLEDFAGYSEDRLRGEA